MTRMRIKEVKGDNEETEESMLWVFGYGIPAAAGNHMQRRHSGSGKRNMDANIRAYLQI